MAEYALISRLKALIGIRALFVSLILGAAYVFKIEFFPNARALSLIIISLYVLTIIYAMLVQKVKNLLLFAYVQLVLDVLAEIALIAITGGIESWFSFTLILTVISSGIVLNRKAGYIMASISSVSYGILLDLQYHGVVPIHFDNSLQVQQFLYRIFIHTTALYFTAYLMGYLTRRIEKTEEKLEEKDIYLKDLEFFNTKVIESLPSGLFTTDTDGNVLIFNRAAEKITGVNKEEIIGKKIAYALPLVEFPGRQGRQEAVLQLPDQGKKIVGLQISGLRDISGKETGYIGVFQDLTQLKELEAEMKNKEKWAAVGELSANIAHEIRNPLASLRGSIEMLREGKVPDKHREKLMEIAISETERLNNIITDFLTYSRPRPLDIQRADLHGLLADTLQLLAHAEQNRGNISVQKAFQGELFALIDPVKMRQVFWNLGVNAIEAMENGGELSVSTADTFGKVAIQFSDTGSGITPEELPRVFYPFYTTKEKGTGLGLAIAYRIVEEHHGRLIARSTPGVGTTFEIILPKEYGA